MRERFRVEWVNSKGAYASRMPLFIRFKKGTHFSFDFPKRGHLYFLPTHLSQNLAFWKAIPKVFTPPKIILFVIISPKPFVFSLFTIFFKNVFPFSQLTKNKRKNYGIILYGSYYNLFPKSEDMFGREFENKNLKIFQWKQSCHIFKYVFDALYL